jgi:hypothetical protein
VEAISRKGNVRAVPQAKNIGFNQIFPKKTFDGTQTGTHTGCVRRNRPPQPVVVSNA